MPRKYIRKPGVTPRERRWTKNDLEAALVDLDKNVMGINQISRLYGIPARTLRRRQKSRNKTITTLGKHPVLSLENEKRLVAHIKNLEAAGFPPDRESIRMLAFQFAEKLQLKHSFNIETRMAGHQWLQSFLERNDELSVRVSEGLSMARGQGLNREEVNKFYELLLKVLRENDLLDKPERIYNMDETGVQCNNKPGKVVATKGSKSVKTVTSGEKGETMTLIGCCNAVGNFLPPVMIIKGVNQKPEFTKGLPPGSKVYMNKKSAYINTDLFKKWLTEHFISNKPDGKVVLILDGHTSHSSAIDMLEEADKHGVILLCLPSHTTSALQPLDVAVYKPFKSFYNKETNLFMRTNPQKKITRSNVAPMIGRAWLRAATPANALAGFRGSGIFPVDPNAISDCEFNIADRSLMSLNDEMEAGPSNDNNRDSPNLIHGTVESDDEYLNNPISPTTIPENALSNEVDEDMTDCEGIVNETQATPIKSKTVLQKQIVPKTTDKFTPSKFLTDALPVPVIPIPFLKRGKQSASVINSKSKIEELKQSKGKKNKEILIKRSKIAEEKENDPENNSKNRNFKSKNQLGKKKQHTGRLSTEKKKQPKYKTTDIIYSSSEDNDIQQLNTQLKKKKGRIPQSTEKKRNCKRNKIDKIYSSSEDNENQQLDAQLKKTEALLAQSTDKKRDLKRKKIARIYSSSEDEANDNICCVCFEDYFLTSSKADWIQCAMCKKWLHDTCTIFKNYCKTCGVSTMLI